MSIMDDAEVGWPECTPIFDSKYIYNYTGTQYSFGDCGSPYSRYIFVVFKLFCECILLNLFIGCVNLFIDHSCFVREKILSNTFLCSVVLEKFSTVTDELSGRDRENSNGYLSKKQIRKMAATFAKLSISGQYLSVKTAVNVFLHSIEHPFGLAELKLNERQNRHDLKVKKLVRAELNILLRERLSSAKVKKIGGPFVRDYFAALLSKLHRSLLVLTGSRCGKGSSPLVNGVSFREVLLTFAFWRIPEIIPMSLQQQRQLQIQHVVLMSCALTIADFLRSATVRSKKQACIAYCQTIPRTIFVDHKEEALHNSSVHLSVSPEPVAAQCISVWPNSQMYEPKDKSLLRGNFVDLVGQTALAASVHEAAKDVLRLTCLCKDSRKLSPLPEYSAQVYNEQELKTRDIQVLSGTPQRHRYRLRALPVARSAPALFSADLTPSDETQMLQRLGSISSVRTLRNLRPLPQIPLEPNVKH